nr:ribonuclease H-like domain-containing protein [Tanacetum cinerariifolium]
MMVDYAVLKFELISKFFLLHKIKPLCGEKSTTSQFIAYCDADWAGYPATRRSTFGYYVFLGDNLLTWSSKRQDALSRSSAEAEYRRVANDVAETSWIRNLLRELQNPLFTATLVYCDNVSVVYMSANPVQHQRTKHREIDIHFVCDKVAACHVRLLHVPSRFQYADIFTKGLSYPLFTDFKSSLSGGYPATRRSTFGYCVFLGDNLLTWSSKRQDTLSRSSAKAEYRKVTNDVAETSWIRNLLRELQTPLFIATLVYCDNISVVYMSANPVQHQRTKHIEIDIHFVCDKVAACHVRVLHVSSRFQYADIFTKGLSYPLFTDFKSSLSVRKSFALTAVAY